LLMFDPVRTFLKPTWDVMLPIPMPWRMLIILCCAIPVIYWLLLRGLPWLMAKSSYILFICAKLLANILLLPEYTFTQYFRQQKRQPASIIYTLDQIITNIITLFQTINLLLEELFKKSLNKKSLIQKEWVIIPAIIIIFMWFFRPILGETGESTIGRLENWWYLFEEWVLYGDAQGSVPRVAPEKFITDYFYILDRQQVTDGWKLLTSRFRGDKKANYAEYSKFWLEQVDGFILHQTRLISQDKNFAVVDVKIQFKKKNKELYGIEYIRFWLVWNNTTGWMIDDSKQLKNWSN
jgi:hypothetical protein